MTKKSLISFDRYRKSLLKKGMAIAVHCTHECYGGIIFSKVIKKPSCDLLTSMRDQALKGLSDKFQKHNQEFHSSREPDMSAGEYTEWLVQEFEDDQRRYPKLKWLDKDDPRNGVIAKANKYNSPNFELRVYPDWLKEVWENELDIEVDEKIDEGMQCFIAEIVEEWGIDLKYNYIFDWDEMVLMDELLSDCCRTKAQFKKLKSSYLTVLFSPIFDNYKHYLVYLASPDTFYFVIGRPYFYPIIAGERSDGSHEITIFEALNEI